MDESSASSSSVRKNFEKNKGAGTITCKLCQNRLKWNGSTTSSFGTTSKGNTPLRLQVKLCCQHGAQLLTHTFLFDFGGQKLHTRIIREYLTIRAVGRELFDSHKMSIRFTPTILSLVNLLLSGSFLIKFSSLSAPKGGGGCRS